MSLTGTYLVTGGAGFIGSHIAAALSGSGARVRVLDDLSTGHAENLEEIGGGIPAMKQKNGAINADLNLADCALTDGETRWLALGGLRVKDAAFESRLEVTTIW